MNKQTLILILVFAFLFVPTGAALKAFNIDPFEIINQEAGTAYCVAWTEPKVETPVIPVPLPTQTTCDKCKGTHQVRSPDNITNLPCPCGAACKCQSMKAEPAKTVGLFEQGEKGKYIVLITAPKWCGWCREIDENVVPALETMKWKTYKFKFQSIERNQHIYIVDYDTWKDDVVVQQFVPNGSINLPMWILIEDGKVVDTWVGYLNGYGVGDFWNRKTINTNDVQVIKYKVK